MMRFVRATQRVILSCSILFATSTALAFNTLFLRDSVMSEMSDAEYEQMRQSFYAALEQLDAGESAEWGVAEAAHGTVTIGEDFEYSGYRCRSTRFENFIGSKRGSGKLKFCKDQNGDWKILSTPR